MTDFQAHPMPQSEQAADPSSLQKDMDGVKGAHLAAGSNPVNGHMAAPQALEAKAANESVADMHKVSSSEEKTGNDMSKQVTQVETSIAGRRFDDDSSSSSSDDDSDDYPQTQVTPAVDQKELAAPQEVVKSNPEQNLNLSKPQEQLIAPQNQTPIQSIEPQKDTINDQKEQPSDELQAQKASGAEGDKSSQPLKPAEAESQIKEANSQLKDEKDAKFQSDEKMTQSHEKVYGNDEQAKEIQPKIPAPDGILVNQNDVKMNDDCVKPEGEIKNSTEIEAQADGQQMNPIENQAKSINQHDKEMAKRLSFHSQALWGAGKDVDMNDEDEDFDSEFKQQCIDALDNDKLFTLNINTYQVCKLNIILSTFGLKLDPKDQVQAQIKKRDAEDRKRRKKQNQLQRKEEKVRPMHNQEVSAHAMPLIAGSQANARYMKGQAADDGYGTYKGVGSKEAGGIVKPDGSLANDPQSMSSYSTKEQKPGAAESQANAEGDKPLDAINDQNVAKQTPVQGALAGVNADQKASGNPAETIESDLRALSPTPRKSERERPNLSYVDMINGNGRRSDSTDEVDGAVADASHTAPGQSNNQKHQKPKDQLHNQAKKQSTEDANKRIRDFFDKLSQHQFSGLMNQPLSKHSPLFEMYKNDFKALAMIDAMHRCGKYTNSKEIISDINQLILTKFSMLSASGDSEDIINIQAFQKYFDQISQGLDNLNLNNKNRPVKPEEPVKNEPVRPKKKPKPDPHKKSDKNMPDTGKDSPVEVVGIEIKAVKAITQEEIAELKTDIVALQNDQRAEIENVAPECITTNANGSKQLDLSNLKANPEVAAKLMQFVKKMTKKNQQREIRRKKDAARRLKKQTEKALNNGQVFNPTETSKSNVNVHAIAPNMGGSQVPQGQDMMAAQNITAANMHQASFQQNAAQMAQFQQGFNYKPGFPQAAAPNQQQQQFLNQFMMNQMLQQHGMNPANLQQLMQNPATLQQMMYQMQQQPGNNAQNQANNAALQKQGGVAGQVAGMQTANAGQAAQGEAAAKKGAANRAAQDDGSSSQSSSSDSDSN